MDYSLKGKQFKKRRKIINFELKTTYEISYSLKCSKPRKPKTYKFYQPVGK